MKVNKSKIGPPKVMNKNLSSKVSINYTCNIYTVDPYVFIHTYIYKENSKIDNHNVDKDTELQSELYRVSNMMHSRISKKKTLTHIVLNKLVRENLPVNIIKIRNVKGC